MRTLHLYLTRQILATLTMTVLVFTFVLLLGSVLKEILPLLVSGQAPILLVFKAIGLLIPFLLVFAFPMGMLTATLLVYGRFSADQELTAARASGISLFRLSKPILFLGIIGSCLCAWINCDLAPRCRTAYTGLRSQIGTTGLMSLLQENQYISLPGGYTIYAQKIEGENLHNVEVYQTNEKENYTRWLKAPKGNFDYDVAAKKMNLVLFNAYGAQKGVDEMARPITPLGKIALPLDVSEPPKKKREAKISDMTFTQLRAKIAELQSQNISPTPAVVQLHRMVSFSFACIGFTLIGIPLGIRAHRRETSMGVAIALGLVLVYYSFIVLGQSLDSKPEYQPHLIVWIPNILFQGIGGWLLWRANKGAC